ncbi:bacillithiol system redox-active protein YtxJ [Chryseobacterium sp. RG1]|uniref:Bacillithiol system redox-active protein YtxJ n=1 Tax=Chryseobacterium tagetis TaxID=2801334 RepID=A0ABS7ZXA0_9FLAO|nr:bacillithiol system redox-active protein YtxJ [Chryseobacterium tagetis]MCA6066359.1 bacillithiol system redox-active protein YtxJ [Chryseobacterium tagetis]
MSFFDKIFGGKEEAKEQKSFWKKIESEDDLKIAIENSYAYKIAIFKHSTSCFISKTVLRNFEKDIESIENTDDIADLYFLDLLAYRPLSNKIAEDLEIRHESPQLLVIENGKVINHASHQDISINQLS